MGREPTDRRFPGRLEGPFSGPDRHGDGSGETLRAGPQGRGAHEEHVRSGIAVLVVLPRHLRHHRLPEDQVRVETRDPRRKPGGLPGGARLRGNHRGLRASLPRGLGPHEARSLSPDHREPSHCVWADGGCRPRRDAAVPGILPDHPRLRHPPRVEPPQGRWRDHGAGGRRDRGHLFRAGRLLRGPARRDHHIGARHGPEDGGRRSGCDDRTAPGDRRRAARRTVDGDADQDRAGRPVPGGHGPQRRITGGGVGGLLPRGLFPPPSRPAGSR